MPPVITRHFAVIGPPYRYMCSTATNLVITTRTPVDLDRPGAGDRRDHVLIPIGPGLDPLRVRRRT